MRILVQKGLARKIFFVLLVLSLSAVTILSTFHIVTSYIDGKKNAQNYQKQFLNNMIKDISNHFLLIEKMMKLCAHSRGVLEEGINERFRFYLWKILKHNPSVFEVSAINKAGKEILVASKIRPEIIKDYYEDLSQEDYFKESMNGKTYYSRVKHAFDNTKPYIVISIPIIKFDGTIDGVLACKIWLLDIQKILINSYFDKNIFVYILDGDREIIAYPEFELVFKHKKIREMSKDVEGLLNLAIQNQGMDQHSSYINPNGIRVFSTAIYMPHFNWFLVVEQPFKQVYKSTISSIIYFLIIFLFLILLVVFVSKKISLWITEPILKLKDITSKITQGDFSAKIDVVTNDEIKELAINFNEMTEKLKKQYYELEGKIEERTKELLLLYSFTSAVSKSLYVEETVKNACEELKVILELDGYVCILYKNNEWQLETASFSKIKDEDVGNLWEYLINNGIVSYISTHHNYKIIDFTEDRFSIEDNGMKTIKSGVVFPILYQGNVIGLIILLSSLDKFFNSNILSAIETCMIQLGVSIVNAEKYEMTENLSFKDPLTKLFNRRYFETKLENEFARCQRYNRDTSLSMIDIDFFKKINDTYGHQSGDAILKQLGQLIQNAIRKSDIAARYGGEEFVILMPETPPKKAYIALERLRKIVEEHAFVIDVEPGYINITISIGLAGYVPYMSNKEELIKQADIALYSAKQNGRNRVCM